MTQACAPQLAGRRAVQTAMVSVPKTWRPTLPLQ